MTSKEKRITEEYIRQIKTADLAREASKAAIDLRFSVSYFFEQIYGDAPPERTVSLLCNFCREFSPQVVFQMIEMASSRGVSAWSAGRYICGIVKHHREDIANGTFRPGSNWAK